MEMRIRDLENDLRDRDIKLEGVKTLMGAKEDRIQTAERMLSDTLENRAVTLSSNPISKDDCFPMLVQYAKRNESLMRGENDESFFDKLREKIGEVENELSLIAIIDTIVPETEIMRRLDKIKSEIKLQTPGSERQV